MALHQRGVLRHKQGCPCRTYRSLGYLCVWHADHDQTIQNQTVIINGKDIEIATANASIASKNGIITGKNETIQKINDIAVGLEKKVDDSSKTIGKLKGEIQQFQKQEGEYKQTKTVNQILSEDVAAIRAEKALVSKYLEACGMSWDKATDLGKRDAVFKKAVQAGLSAAATDISDTSHSS